MGLFWDLLQQSQISSQTSRTETLETRVQRLESELYATRKTLNNLIGVLEQHFGRDIDGDGHIG